jgi:cupin fold WbuC family metalloprotein
MKLIDTSLLDSVSHQAAASERLRQNYNFHDFLGAPCQRLLNALEPGTVVPVHRHMHTAETYVVLRGSIELKYYNDDKEVIDEVVVAPALGIHGVHIPQGTWHGMKVLEHGTVIFETKDGPYTPVGPEDVLMP